MKMHYCLALPFFFVFSDVTSIHSTSDTVDKASHIEVDQEANLYSAQLQVGNQLCLVQRDYFLHRFEFNDHLVIHEDINPVSNIEFYFVIDYRQTNLTQCLETSLTNLISQTSLIGRFQQSGTKSTMNFNCGSNNLRSKRVG